MYNRGKIRDRERLLYTIMGRVTKPGHIWKKPKRQTFSVDAHYIHVKYHDNRMTPSMGTVCNLFYLEKTEAKQKRNKGILDTL